MARKNKYRSAWVKMCYDQWDESKFMITGNTDFDYTTAASIDGHLFHEIKDILGSIAAALEEEDE